MSLANFEAFCKSAETDQDLQAKLKAIQPGTSAAEEIAALAKSRGFEVSAAELRAGMGVGVLSEEELAHVSGGIAEPNRIEYSSLKYSAALKMQAFNYDALSGIK